jgi:hypothetical protein
MSIPSLRPPLPPPLSHEGIRFVFDRASASDSLTPETIAAIATALNAVLPAGDLSVDAHGNLRVLGATGGADSRPSLWFQAGLLAGIERSSL